jgi:maltose O-acetyltransferase
MKFHPPYYPQTVLRELVLNLVAGSAFVPRHVRTLIYRMAGADVRTIRIAESCRFVGSNFSIGADAFVNWGCFIDTHARVDIGDGCFIGPRVSLLTTTHLEGTETMRAGRCVAFPIVVGAGTWIGASSTILAGARIGEGCILAAGSVVKEHQILEEHCLYAGVPAVLKAHLPRDSTSRAEIAASEGVAL